MLAVENFLAFGSGASERADFSAVKSEAECDGLAFDCFCVLAESDGDTCLFDKFDANSALRVRADLPRDGLSQVEPCYGLVYDQTVSDCGPCLSVPLEYLFAPSFVVAHCKTPRFTNVVLVYTLRVAFVTIHPIVQM